jgi:hypothetical protein
VTSDEHAPAKCNDKMKKPDVNFRVHSSAQ